MYISFFLHNSKYHIGSKITNSFQNFAIWSVVEAQECKKFISYKTKDFPSKTYVKRFKKQLPPLFGKIF